jgi:hydrogenase expression/formation protein HypE
MKDDKIMLDHGAGGRMSHSLIADIMLPVFDNPVLSQLDDGAILDIDGMRIAFSTDTFTVDPIFFPGGNIGDLAVNGTVNDIAMCGANPLFLSVGLLIEEGFPMEELKRVLRAMGNAADAAGVKIVTGDTKVVPKGAADRIFINTSGLGLIPEGVEISCQRAIPDDRIILSGGIAEHGMTVLTRRAGMSFESSIVSDTAPLNHMVGRMLSASRDIHVLRDPTRGGVGTTLNEIAQSSRVGIVIYEDRIPLNPQVEALCELMGLDPLYIANEGKLVAIVGKDHVKEVLSAMKGDRCGREAAIIGEVVAENPGSVLMKTKIGGTRIVDMLTGEPLPRIC